jgi:hypothetical protein
MEEDALLIHDLNLSVLGCATQTIFSSLDNTALNSGLLVRFAIISPETKPPRIPQYELGDIELYPASLVKWLHEIREQTAKKMVRFGNGVLKYLDDEIDAPIDNSPSGTMVKRIGVMTRKVAMLAAAGRPEETQSQNDYLVVSMEDAKAAVIVAKRWMAYARDFETRLGSSRFEVDLERCLDVLKGRDWVTRREVARRVHVEAKVMRSIEETLVMRGMIESRAAKTQKTGRTPEMWRLLKA